MSEQIKADFSRAQKFIKAEQYTQAITILKPHVAHPRIAALIADLEIKRKPSGNILKTVLWIVLVVVVGIIAGGGGYALGESQTKAEYEIPIDLEVVFIKACAANTDLSGSECSSVVRTAWRYYRSDSIDCFGLIEVPGATEDELLRCIGNITD